MPRPLKVPRDHALEAAMLVFWTKGFAATSVDDLQDAMGLQRGSFYFQFGDKKKLFLEVLEHYKANVVEKRRAIIREQQTVPQAVRFFFKLLVEHSTSGRKNAGCLNTNSATELGSSDPEATERLRRSMLEWTAFWTELLEQGKARKELDESLDTAAVARSLVAFTQGINVLGKVKMDRGFLTSSVDLMLSSLFARECTPLVPKRTRKKIMRRDDAE